MREYIADQALPEMGVAALLHRAGECNCGSFAAPGERRDLAVLSPETGRGVPGAARGRG
jgi:hypothetical protein